MTHGWGGTRDRGDAAIPMNAFGASASKGLRDAGYNVLTWDSRGFGESGGTVTVDHKDFEGRDVQALLDWLATQPEAQLDAPGDPRAGMHGASYAGGIELVAPAIEPRIDAIAPSIAWHSLLTALYREDLAKAGWGAVLTGAGLATATLLGVVAPGGIQTGTLDPHIMSAFLVRRDDRPFSAEDKQWFADRGPGGLVGAHPHPDAADPGHAGHAVHAVGGDPQLRAAGAQRRPAEDDLVLRRARRVPDRRGRGEQGRQGRDRVDGALPRA